MSQCQRQTPRVGEKQLSPLKPLELNIARESATSVLFLKSSGRNFKAEFILTQKHWKVKPPMHMRSEDSEMEMPPDSLLPSFLAYNCYRSCASMFVNNTNHCITVQRSKGTSSLDIQPFLSESLQRSESHWQQG